MYMYLHQRPTEGIACFQGLFILDDSTQYFEECRTQLQSLFSS